MQIQRPGGSRHRPRQTPQRQAEAPLSAPVLGDEDWQRLRQTQPQLVQRAQQEIRALAAGQRVWAEALDIGDPELLGMAQRAAANMDLKRYNEAELTFGALCTLDPYVPWFWLSLGDARMRLGKNPDAIEAYTHCIRAATSGEQPLEEYRPACLKRGTLYVRMGRYQEAFEDFRRVVEMDTTRVSDGERAWLAVQQLVQDGRIPRDALDALPKPM